MSSTDYIGVGSFGIIAWYNILVRFRLRSTQISFERSQEEYAKKRYSVILSEVEGQPIQTEGTYVQKIHNYKHLNIRLLVTPPTKKKFEIIAFSFYMSYFYITIIQ